MVMPNTSVDGQSASQETLVAAPPATGTTPSPEKADSSTTDYKAETERLTGERDDLRRQLDRALGRVKTNVPDQTLQGIQGSIRRLEREMRRNAVEQTEMEEPAKQQALRSIQQEEQTDQESARFTSHATRLANRLNARLEKATFLRGNAGLQELLAKWNSSTNLDQVDDAYDALDDFIDTELDKYTKGEIKTANDKVEQERKRANRANGTLEVGAPTGTMPAGIAAATRDNIDNLYMGWEREHPNGTPTNPYEAKYRAFRESGWREI